MGCLFIKEINEEMEQDISLSSQISELPYIEPLKTMEQKRIEYIQTIFKVEYKKQNKKY